MAGKNLSVEELVHVMATITGRTVILPKRSKTNFGGLHRKIDRPGVSSFCVWFGPITTPYRESSVGERVSLIREPDAGTCQSGSMTGNRKRPPSQTRPAMRRKPLNYPPADYSHCTCSRLYPALSRIAPPAILPLREARRSPNRECYRREKPLNNGDENR